MVSLDVAFDIEAVKNICSELYYKSIQGRCITRGYPGYLGMEEVFQECLLI